MKPDGVVGRRADSPGGGWNPTVRLAAHLGGLGCRFLLAVVWLYAGSLKIGDLDASVRAVKAYRILPTTLAELVGAALPFVEIALGLLLLVGLATRVAAAASGLLMTAFIIGIASAWARGLQIDCGCFGGGGDLPDGIDPGYALEIVRDLGLLAAAALLIWLPRTWWSVDTWLAGSTSVEERGDTAR